MTMNECRGVQYLQATSLGVFWHASPRTNPIILSQIEIQITNTVVKNAGERDKIEAFEQLTLGTSDKVCLGIQMIEKEQCLLSSGTIAS